MSSGVQSLPTGTSTAADDRDSEVGSSPRKSRIRGVSLIEGETALKRMPFPEYSRARERVMASTAALVAVYHISPLVGLQVMHDAMLTTLPEPCAMRWGRMTLTEWKMLLTLISKTPLADMFASARTSLHRTRYISRLTVIFGFRHCQRVFLHVGPTGVVDEDVQRAIFGFGQLESLLPVFFFGDVGLCEDGLSARRDDLLCSSVNLINRSAR